MARVFSVLAVLTVLLLAANFFVGLWGGDFNAAAKRKRETHARLIDLERKLRADRTSASFDVEQARQESLAANDGFQTPRARMTLHMLLGSAAALVTVLVNSITITYFIGTSRWCKEVCETYRLSAELAERAMRLKRSTFPWALAGSLAVIGIIGLGAAADPSGANWALSAHFVLPHYVSAMIGLVIVIASFGVQIGHIADNYRVVEEVMHEVARIRSPADKALDIRH